MNFLNIDFESPRVKSFFRTVQYAVLTLFVVAGTIVLVFAGQGYDFNRKTGEVIQNGLLLVNSSPENAIVYVNGQAESDVTPSRLALPEGVYDIRLSAEGYREWSKQIRVAGSGVEWLYYPLLIPETLTTTDLASFKTLTDISPAPNGETILARQKSSTATFRQLSLSNQRVSNESQLVIPPALITITKPNDVGTLTFEGWSSNSNQVLISHVSGKKQEYILLNITNPSESQNLTDAFDLDFRDLRMINNNPERYYALVNNDLRLIDLSNTTVSGPIIRDVANYVLFTDRFITYFKTNNAGGTELGLVNNDQSPRVLLNLDGKPAQYAIEFAEFDKEFYLALLDKTAGSAMIYRSPESGSEITLDNAIVKLKLNNSKYLTFSRNGQIVAIQSNNRVVSYDIDRERSSSFQLPFKTSEDRYHWLDGFRMMAYNNKSVLHIFEFDGANIQAIVPSDPNFIPSISGNAETLTIVRSPSSASQFLTSVSLVAETPTLDVSN